MPEYSFILAGRLGVGKSAIFTRLQHDMYYSDDKTRTKRFDMGLENFVYECTVNGKDIKVTLWDTGGLERYDSMTANYYRFCHAVILVYDLEAEETLYCLKDWIQEAKTSSRWPERVVFSLWGNKSDSEYQAATKQLQQGIDAFLIEHGIPQSLNFKVSAKTGSSVEDALQKVAETVDDSFNTVDFDLSGDARDTARLNFSVDSYGSPRKKKCSC